MFNPEIMRWARETAGLNLADAAHRLDISKVERLISYESGKEMPSRPVLLKMAKQYRRSLLTFYLETPPTQGNRGEDFRTVTADRTIAGEATLDALIRDLRARQSLVHATLEDEDINPIAFIGSTKMSDGIQPTLEAIKTALQMDHHEFRTKRKIDDAFALLRSRAEAIGIFVLLIGNLGSHHSDIPAETFRGFAISDPIAPFIVINDQDAKAAWSFTLLHEMAHLCLGTTGISGASSDKIIEQFCNDVASEFLLPKSELNEFKINSQQSIEDTISLISDFARDRNVSRSLVSYKLFRVNLISKQYWQSLDIKLRELWQQEKIKNKAKEKPKGAGPEYYVVRRHKLGKAMLEFANRTVNSGILSPVKAAKVLGVKPRSVYPLLVNISRSGFENRAGGII
jgi:Zn-dependent peptidase ImmA (M78 family)/transcriptional regulator with XRE-family HTH domain